MYSQMVIAGKIFKKLQAVEGFVKNLFFQITECTCDTF